MFWTKFCWFSICIFFPQKLCNCEALYFYWTWAAFKFFVIFYKTEINLDIIKGKKKVTVCQLFDRVIVPNTRLQQKKKKHLTYVLTCNHIQNSNLNVFLLISLYSNWQDKEKGQRPLNKDGTRHVPSSEQSIYYNKCMRMDGISCMW